MSNDLIYEKSIKNKDKMPQTNIKTPMFFVFFISLSIEIGSMRQFIRA